MTVGDLINLLRFTNSAIEVKIRIGDSDYPIRAELEGRFKEMQTFQLFAELPAGAVLLEPATTVSVPESGVSQETGQARTWDKITEK